ncbi:MAG: hypothetical protein A2172_03750 [Candidatus Woykebacteria bacterium RBG_13_40_15]|uniref:Uncharacterized protein n=1 Tax=Candidatus Woykebacteria bacterium RBG_13_40_15 TaxID=1802593 RepID=A0A1G1W6G7_9BACT|nr:MAG: hypothetical protein A2172_03750 [Candidatus Woykebacteria bacterium RBG_13_40_15]
MTKPKLQLMNFQSQGFEKTWTATIEKLPIFCKSCEDELWDHVFWCNKNEEFYCDKCSLIHDHILNKLTSRFIKINEYRIKLERIN